MIRPPLRMPARIFRDAAIGIFSLALGILGLRAGLSAPASDPADLFRTKFGACCAYGGRILIGDLPDPALLPTFERDMAKPRSSRCAIPSTPEVFHAGFAWIGVTLALRGETRWFGAKPVSLLGDDGASIYFARRELGFLLCIPIVCLTGVLSRRVIRWWRLHGTAHCRGCTYDLTGNHSGICPECGASTGQMIAR